MIQIILNNDNTSFRKEAIRFKELHPFLNSRHERTLVFEHIRRKTIDLRKK